MSPRRTATEARQGRAQQRWEDALGLYFYNARWYDPALGRFIQPDTIVPEPGNPQALNRYSYCLNNPVRYSDPSGHNPLLVGALIGGLVGGLVAYVPQAANNLINGQSLGDAALNVDWGKVVGGAVAGATLGLGTTLGAGFLGTIGLGAIGVTAGGQASAVTEASYNQLDSFMHDHGWSNSELVRDAFESGFLDPKTMTLDAAGGAISAGLGYGMEKAVAPVFARFGDQVFKGDVQMVRIMPGKGPLCASIFWSGKEVIIPASTLEQIIKSMAVGSYDVASELIQQLVDAEAQQWVEQQFSQGVP